MAPPEAGLLLHARPARLSNASAAAHGPPAAAHERAATAAHERAPGANDAAGGAGGGAGGEVPCALRAAAGIADVGAAVANAVAAVNVAAGGWNHRSRLEGAHGSNARVPMRSGPGKMGGLLAASPEEVVLLAQEGWLQSVGDHPAEV